MKTEAGLALGLSICLVWGCAIAPGPEGSSKRDPAGSDLNQVAEAYVKLALLLGNHDADYVDAYYGPPEWREAARDDESSLDEIRRRATKSIERLESAPVAPEAEETIRLRQRYLAAQLAALVVRTRMLAGERFSFDEESRGLYDAVAPTHGDEHFQTLLGELDPLLPGDGDVARRFAEYRERFVVPPDRIDAVFSAAIEACRDRTRRYVDLPGEESFDVEYVTDKPWGAYNWYRGGYHSLIQVNTQLPFYIDKAVELACHEGYPGHHVYNVLLERHLVRERGWIEFTVYPLFSPQSLIAEGTADYGIDLAFPADERIELEERVLFPLAGLEPSEAERYYRVLEKTQDLAFAGIEAARRYLDGEIDSDEAVRYLERYLLMTPERAAQRLRFIHAYRSYVINYNLGRELVRDYIESRAGDDPVRRWSEFTALLSSPRLPSGLRRPPAPAQRE